jgi:hypothetical protein
MGSARWFQSAITISSGCATIAGALIGLFAIARAWQLVGARDTGLISTVAGMAQQQGSKGTYPTTGHQDPAADRDDAG